MKDFLKDFNKRVSEIEQYFELVDHIEQLSTLTDRKIIFPSREYIVDINLQKILKSNCYLLLYNLIESSIRNGIVAIHDVINIENLKYQELTSKIQKLWINNDLTKSFLDRFITKDTISKNIEDILENISNEHHIIIDANNISISGNLDAKTIKNLIDIYGFYGNLGIPEKEINYILDFVVKMRCDLAHGNISFTDSSHSKTWSELIIEKDKIIKYLSHLLNNIENFIDHKKYLKVNNK